ncbi:uncharacterized protein [Hoplias malabaricus]|uniref:uncharacterized protein n=1 Tax=Hoplias malabaricus TaxID=27720 RepID=UPI00346349FC
METKMLLFTLTLAAASQEITLDKGTNCTENCSTQAPENKTEKNSPTPINSNASTTGPSSTMTSDVANAPHDPHEINIQCVKNGSVATSNNTKIFQVTSFQFLIDPNNTCDVKVNAGATLNLSCSTETQTLFNISGSFLIRTNESKEHTGVYVCTVGHPNKPPSNSGIDLQNDHISEPVPVVLKCICRPNIQCGSAGMRCASEIETYSDKCNTSQMDKTSKGSDNSILELKNIITFLLGAASTAFILCAVLCLVSMCKRLRNPKVKHANNAGVNLKTVKIQNSQDDEDQKTADEQTPLQGPPVTQDTDTVVVYGEVNEVEDTPGEDVDSGENKATGEEGKTEVDYACIDYSLLKNRGAEAQNSKDEETEYAEIQIKKEAEAQGDESLQAEAPGDETAAENLEQQEEQADV